MTVLNEYQPSLNFQKLLPALQRSLFFKIPGRHLPSTLPLGGPWIISLNAGSRSRQNLGLEVKNVRSRSGQMELFRAGQHPDKSMVVVSVGSSSNASMAKW